MVTVKVPTSHRHHRGVPLKSARDRMDIISAYQQVGTYRGAAEMCGTTHKTVKRVVERAEAGDARRSGRRGPQLRRGDGSGRRTGREVGGPDLGEAAAADRPRRRVRGFGAELPPPGRRAKALWRKDHHRGRRPAVWSPGEYLVIDWAEAAPGLFLFCAVLAFSRWRFVRVRHRPEGHHHAGVDRRSAGRDRWCPGQGAGRPDGAA